MAAFAFPAEASFQVVVASYLAASAAEVAALDAASFPYPVAAADPLCEEVAASQKFAPFH